MLSKKAKYAINALVYLTKHQEEGPIAISQIAEAQNIPRKFLEAILLDLRHAGILISRKGKNGGYRLNKAPEKIHMAEVMRLFDGAIALLPCVTYMFYERCDECIDEETCGIREVFTEIRNETVEKLKAATLADIIKREQTLKKS
jgi:Rrf2 family protein